MSVLITGAELVTTEKVERLDVRMEGEQIREIAPDLLPAHSDETVIDATGKYLLPGGVDVHTHMDLLVGGLRTSDDFFTGTRAAACGGTTTIVDHMAFAPRGAGLLHQIETYHGLAGGKAVIDYGFHGVVDRIDSSVLNDLARLEDEGISSLKFYMTYDGRLGDEAILALLERCAELGVLPAVHCENHAIITWLRAQFAAAGLTSPRYHALSRPALCEAEAVQRVLALAHTAGRVPIYIVHTSSAAALEAASGCTFDSHHILETCPQYLVLDSSCYERPKGEGLNFIMSPPLRTKDDCGALWAGLADGRISTIGTDHCSFFSADKLRGKDDFTQCPNGAPGVELRLALIYSEGVIKRGMDIRRMVDLCATTPARLFGLYPQKGTLRVGGDADLVIFDPEQKVTVTYALLHENVDYSPYEGFELTGYPEMTFSRGKLIAHKGTFLGKAGHGRFIKRQRGDMIW